MELKNKAIRGTAWSLLSQSIRLAIRFLVIAILARLLSPDDFGLIAMVTVFTNLLFVLNDLGIAQAIIQKKDLSENQVYSSFWLNMGEGLILSLLFVVLSPAIAAFYGETRLIPLIIVLAPTFFIASLGMIQFGLLAKRMDFKSIGISEILSAAIAGAIAIFLAYTGAGVWSLIFQSLAASTILSISLWLFCDWSPKLVYKWSEVKGILGYGLFFTGYQVLNYFSRNLDNLLIGRFLGSEALGFYDIAYKVLLFPIQYVSAVAGRVMFPALSIIQEDKAKVRSAYIRANRYIAAICFPLITAVIVLAPQFTRIVLGSQWERAIFIIQVLAVVAIVQSTTTTVSWLYLSLGKTNILFYWGIITVVVYGAAFLIGLKWDIEGVAVAYAIASLLLVYPAFAIPFRFVDMRFIRFLKQFVTIMISTFFAGAMMVVARLLLETKTNVHGLVILLAATALGLPFYATILFILDKRLCNEVLNLFKRRSQL